MMVDHNIALRLAEVCLATNKIRNDRDGLAVQHRDSESPTLRKVVTDERLVATSTAAILEYESHIVVSFQGTITDFGRDGNFSWESLIDWAYNFDINRVDGREEGLAGKVHEGFLRQLDLIYTEVKAAVLSSSAKPVLVTGHSQGGAIALLAAGKFESDQLNVQSVYTFAAPRAGDRNFAESIRAPVFRVEFGNDLVPHLPFTFQRTRNFFARAIDSVTGFVSRSQRATQILNGLQGRIESNGYSATGSLVYRPANGVNAMNLSADDEAALYAERRSKLKTAGKELAGHHNLDHYISMFS